jgi:hypothetical protein
VPFLFQAVDDIAVELFRVIILNQENKQKLTEPNDIDLYTALAIFINNAPQLIDGILDAAEMEDLLQVEKLTARLSMYSSSAQLAVFTEIANNLIIAVRERKLSIVKNQAEKLRCTFEQMTKSANATAMEQRIALEEKSAEFQCSK